MGPGGKYLNIYVPIPKKQKVRNIKYFLNNQLQLEVFLEERIVVIYVTTIYKV